MAEQWQLRKGSTAENEGFVGAEGELTYDTTTKAIHVHDGETAGGALIDVVVAYQLPTSANNYTWYRKYASGWVEQGGYRTSVSNTIITLPIPMADTNYTLIKTINNDYQGNANGVTWGSASAAKISTTQIRLNQTSGGDMQSWQVSGIAA